MKVNSKSRTKKIIAVTWIIPIIVASPLLFSSRYPFTIHSDYGVISRQICTDRFDELDDNTGTFRRVYFIILFFIMYFVPMVIIIGTCTTIAICLLRPIVIENTQLRRRDSKRRNEVNKRKVSKRPTQTIPSHCSPWIYCLMSSISAIFLAKSRTKCSVCRYVGKLPNNMPQYQQEPHMTVVAWKGLM